VKDYGGDVPQYRGQACPQIFLKFSQILTIFAHFYQLDVIEEELFTAVKRQDKRLRPGGGVISEEEFPLGDV